MSEQDQDRRSGEKCPICAAPSVARYRPFCSARCANVDLNRWLTGRYAIPAAVEDDEDDSPRTEGGQDV